MDNNPKEKKIKTEIEISKELTNIMNDLEQYVNENRSKDLFSKHGEIEHPSQLGDYIKWYYNDIIEDFEKDL